MARFRNPRFAPEFLDKRLSPSGISGAQFLAQVATLDDPEPLPPPGPGDTPPPPPPTPVGPDLPG